MDIPRAEALTHIFPFLVRLILPQGVLDFEKNIPASDVTVFATTNAVLVRKDLHPQLVYLLAQALSEVHGGAGFFQHVGQFPTLTDPEYAMDPDALDFYRNGPSFLDRYLPFWMAIYARRATAVLIAALAIGLPFWSLGPRIYDWVERERVSALYRRLRIIEVALHAEFTDAKMVALQAEMDKIDRAARILPMRHSDHFFSVRERVEQVRTRSRRASTAKLIQLAIVRRMFALAMVPTIDRNEVTPSRMRQSRHRNCCQLRPTPSWPWRRS